MSVSITSWTHGYSVVPQTPAAGTLLQVNGQAYTDVVGASFGWGRTFRVAGNQRCWFHIPIPTPTLRDDSELFLDQFFVLFRSDPASGITSINAWNGPQEFFVWNDPDPVVLMDGDWSSIETRGPAGVTHGDVFSNAWTPRQPNGDRFWVGFSLGLSVLVANGGRDSDITFFSAGANFAGSAS